MFPGFSEILLVVLVVLVVFGSSRVPHIMENLAKGINSFKKGLKEETNDHKPLLKNEVDRDKE